MELWDKGAWLRCPLPIRFGLEMGLMRYAQGDADTSGTGHAGHGST